MGWKSAYLLIKTKNKFGGSFTIIKTNRKMFMRCFKIIGKVYILSCILYVCYLACRIFIADRFIIPSDSMSPTLVQGDVIVVNKTLMGARIYSNFDFSKDGVELVCWRTRGLRGIRRGDIVVFNRANHRQKIKFIINNVYCKRCIGLPGDTIMVKNGHYVNNNYEGVLGNAACQRQLERTPDSLIDMSCRRVLPNNEHLAWTIHDFGPLYIPRKGDIINIMPKDALVYKAILEWETGETLAINWDRNEVNAGSVPIKRHTFTHNYYFMAGDNVGNSADSRYFGVVPEEYVIGIASAVVRDFKIRLL